jgi:hypothetical protein
MPIDLSIANMRNQQAVLVEKDIIFCIFMLLLQLVCNIMKGACSNWKEGKTNFYEEYEGSVKTDSQLSDCDRFKHYHWGCRNNRDVNDEPSGI